ncbi:hypothetical protein PDE_06866 [Penicillium oxalicum 114-2]|uniref:Uncharacterized protein n=1 Tax=Penicillium oxalicum (strain 114-2 / CGMCC 5302) TaxID=933388 RepID=S8BAS2_PENO1|nr:hypothetical protein PDE_06866 [Penicillium oxalicum 114-2]
MDTHYFKPPLPLSPNARTTSATFPLTHGSPSAPRSDDQPTLDRDPFADNQNGHDASLAGTGHRRHQSRDFVNSLDNTLSHARPRTVPKPVELPSFDGIKSQHPNHHHRHKHSKSRELRFPRPMTHFTSSASARGLFPSWSGGRDKERDSDNGLLRPLTREATRSRWGSDSTGRLSSGSRRGSLLDVPEQHERLGPIQRQDLSSMEDLEKVKKRREQGERHIRSALSGIGTLATELTRRLDYTYYNLLEKITALNSTISSFQELSDSAATLLNEFEKETSSLDQDIRKQINDLQGFEPQIHKADALAERMQKGRRRAEELNKRLDGVKSAIDRWEQKEAEWQTRTSRRLRIFWGIVTSAALVLLLAVTVRRWPAEGSLQQAGPPVIPPTAEAVNQSAAGFSSQSDMWDSLRGVDESTSTPESAWYPARLAERLRHLEQTQTLSDASSTSRSPASTGVSQTGHDPFRLLDEL